MIDFILVPLFDSEFERVYDLDFSARLCTKKRAKH
jgi:hypothetical protein